VCLRCRRPPRLWTTRTGRRRWEGRKHCCHLLRNEPHDRILAAVQFQFAARVAVAIRGRSQFPGESVAQTGHLEPEPEPDSAPANNPGSSLGDDAGPYSNFYNRAADYGSADNDILHRFSFSFVYALPVGEGRQFLSSGVLGKIVGAGPSRT
jgi:hypothetical protein